MPELDSGAYAVVLMGILALIGCAWLVLQIRKESHLRDNDRTHA
jgi:hypothetical protein